MENIKKRNLTDSRNQRIYGMSLDYYRLKTIKDEKSENTGAIINTFLW